MKQSTLNKWKAYDKSNPEVYREFKRMAIEAKADGVDKWSARAMVAVIRWEFKKEIAQGDDRYKLNDHYAVLMARRLVREMPSFKNFFEFRG